MDWAFLTLFIGGAVALAWRQSHAARQTEARIAAVGLAPVADLLHLPPGLSATALWCLSDGGFESRLLRGTVSSGADDVEVTAFDLETLRERRGEWAYLPVERPFRVRGTVSVAVCELPADVPHLLCKREGRGDQLVSDDWLERELSVAKSVRSRLGIADYYAAELPPGLAHAARAVPRCEGWRIYASDEVALSALMQGGLAEALAGVQMRDLVIELVGRVLVAYPATRDALGPDGFAELCGAAARATVAVRRALAQDRRR